MRNVIKLKKAGACIVILALCLTGVTAQVEIRKNANSDPRIELKSTGFNTFVGDSAGYVTNNSGINNTSLGYRTLRNNLFGQSNTGIGSGVLSNNSNGHHNTAVGSSALYTNTTGHRNTAIGYNALNQNTTGFNSVAIGAYALETSQASLSNIGLGTYALRFTTQGNNNVALGVSALTANTIGSLNIAIGNSSLFTNTHGNKNTVVGMTAMYDNTTGTENTVQGYDALRKNTTGNNNTALGSNALKNNTSGNYNLAIGDSSLVSNTSGQNNTAIGSRADIGAGLNNATALGARAMATASNSIVLGAIQGVNGATSGTNVGIGTSAPDANAILEVSSTSQGVLIPRMTTSQRKLISSPAPGLMVYDLDKQTIYLYDGVKWNPMMFTTSEGKLPLFARDATDGIVGDNFGMSVSLQGNYAIIGAPNNDVNGNADQGSAYIFFRSGGLWSQQAILTANDGAPGYKFGISVDLDPNGEMAIIGSSGATVNGNTFQGCAFIFVRNGTIWTQQAKLTASDGAASDEFGGAVCLEGDYAVVAAASDDEGGFDNRGSVYVFYRNPDWYDNQPHQAKLLASDGTAGDAFGYDISLSGEYLVCGAPYYYYNGLPAGSIYIFNRSGTTWTQQAKILSTIPFSLFGQSVSLDGDYIAVGSPLAEEHGRITIFFKDSGWTDNHPVQAILSPEDLILGDLFGYDISISGDYVIASAPNHDNNQGASYIFKRIGTNWNFFRKSNDETKQPDEQFGFAVSIHGFNCVYGIPEKNGGKGEVQFGNIE